MFAGNCMPSLYSVALGMGWDLVRGRLGLTTGRGH